MKPILTAVVVLALGACTTHLEVAKAGDDEASRSGWAYPLQFTQWNTTLKRRLASCDPEVKALIKADIVPATVDDGDHVYVISSTSLISPMKISDLQVAWEEGRLKSVNASAEDRTAQTVTAAVQGIGKLISVAAGPTMGIVSATGEHTQGPPPDGPRLMCREETIANLKIVDLTQDQVEAAGSAIAVATAEATRLKDELDQVGDDADIAAKLKAQIEKIASERKNLAAAQKKLDAALTFLTHEQLVTWPERSNINWTDEGNAFDIPTAALRKWFVSVNFRNGQPEMSGDRRVESPASDQQLRDVASEFRAFMRIERIGSYGQDPSRAMTTVDSVNDKASRKAGIRYRLPVRGRLVVCREQLCTSADRELVVAEAAGPVLQLGQVFYAPFSSPPLSNGTYAIAFDQYGRPVSAGVSRKTASAETAANMFRDVATEAATVAAEVHRTPLEQLQEQRAFVEEQKKLADAQAALNPTKTPLQELQELRDLAQARKEYQDAVAALEPAAPDPNADTRALQAGFEADAALLKAKADLIAAGIALRDLEAKRDGP
ncbi:MAG: hypothetical protein ACJ8ER_15940 [Allosphingosinicella sp.]